MALRAPLAEYFQWRRAVRRFNQHPRRLPRRIGEYDVDRKDHPRFCRVLRHELGNDTFVIPRINEAKKSACSIAGNDRGVNGKFEALFKAFSYGLTYALG